MMSKLNASLVTAIGVLLLLPLIGVTALESFSGWALALIILVIGVMGLMDK
ncbi:hypothetical protein HN903_03830 [archaeon]|jgi:hypothetical protein|nr:hypothetical protein [archaeon]MBT7128860.1 hypothetical protein [archaeon]